MFTFKTFKLAGFLCYLFLIAILATSCQKKISQPTTTAATSSRQNTIPSGYIMTPVGLMPAANVHTVEAGYAVTMRNGHALKIRKDTKEQVEDWGEMKPGAIPASILSRKAVTSGGGGSSSVPSGGSTGANWVTYSQYSGNGQPIMYFQSNYTVPTAPQNPGPLFYIWSGISPSPSSYPLIQPVLQWGSNGVFGGVYWTVANWCILDATHAAISPYTPVIFTGTQLQGIVNCYNTDTVNHTYDYTSSYYYNGGPNNILNIEYNTTYNNFNGGTGTFPTIGAITNAYEVLEVPFQVTSTTQYPNQPWIYMTSIILKTGATWETATAVPNLNWSTYANGNLGEWTQIANGDGNGDGEVNIYF